MMQRVFVAVLTVIVFMSGYAARMWTDRGEPVPPPPAALAREYAPAQATGDQKKRDELDRAAVVGEIEKFRSQIAAYSTQVQDIDNEFEREFAALLNPGQTEKWNVRLKQRAERMEADAKKPPVRTLLTDDDIRRAQDRSMTSVYWMVTVTPHLERFTKDFSLDPAQQTSLRALLALRRNKYIALLDATPHPTIRLNRLVPMLDRVLPPEAKQGILPGEAKK